MNARGTLASDDGGGGARNKKILRPRPLPVSVNREKDEDLLLFREMHKREKEQIVSLLQPVSEEFEANGMSSLYRVASGKRGGLESLAENGKNDYDWLKTPPATPLFPSLEMEKNAVDFVVHKELPLIQPLSRFADTTTTVEPTLRRAASPGPKPKNASRNLTPSSTRRPSILSTDDQNKNNLKRNSTKLNLQKMNHTSNDSTTTAAKPTKNRESESHINMSQASSSLSKNTNMDSTSRIARSRGISPLVRSKLPAQIIIPGISDETPKNLRTERSVSATRGGDSVSKNQVNGSQRLESLSNTRSRRQSCSPSVTRGRKQEGTQRSEGNPPAAVSAGQKMRSTQQGHGTTNVFGSRMVDKFLNARKLNSEERQGKQRFQKSINEGSGYGRVISKS